MSDFAVPLYWSMPTPQDFVSKITTASRNARAIVLSLTEYPPSGIWDAVRRGLCNANIHEPVLLTITDGMDIATEIGTHFSLPTMPPESLAHHVHGYQHAIILLASGKRAQQACAKYATAFMDAIEHAPGDVRLIMAISDGINQTDGTFDRIHLIAFDGALPPNEMDAYVTQRMVSVAGPGSTRLLRHLVTEYAGFDVALAEDLMAMDIGAIEALPDTLTPLLTSGLLRWSSASWLAGTVASNTPRRHPLHEWYAATHEGPQAESFRRAVNERYWRACLKALIPWMEERRPKILKLLDRPLSILEQQHGGPGKIRKKIGEQETRVAREELEYNDLTYFFGRFPLTSQKEVDAVSICRRAKSVRDNLAHLRKPGVADIRQLITEMDNLVEN